MIKVKYCGTERRGVGSGGGGSKYGDEEEAEEKVRSETECWGKEDKGQN